MFSCFMFFTCEVISLVVVSNVAQFKSFELSTTLWALAKLGSMEDPRDE